MVGYDGRAWVKGLASRNALSVSLAERQCRATFDYSARQNEQVVISVVCNESASLQRHAREGGHPISPAGLVDLSSATRKPALFHGRSVTGSPA